MFYKQLDDPKSIKNGDVIAFKNSGGVIHTFIIKEIVLKDDKIDWDKTKVRTKNGQAELTEETLQKVYDECLKITKKDYGENATMNMCVYTRK